MRNRLNVTAVCWENHRTYSYSITRDNDPIDLTIGDGKIIMTNPDDKGQAEHLIEVLTRETCTSSIFSISGL